MNKRKGFYCDMMPSDFDSWQRRIMGYASRDTAATEPLDDTPAAAQTPLRKLGDALLTAAIHLAWVSVLVIALYALTW